MRRSAYRQATPPWVFEKLPRDCPNQFRLGVLSKDVGKDKGLHRSFLQSGGLGCRSSEADYKSALRSGGIGQKSILMQQADRHRIDDEDQQDDAEAEEEITEGPGNALPTEPFVADPEGIQAVFGR